MRKENTSKAAAFEDYALLAGSFSRPRKTLHRISSVGFCLALGLLSGGALMAQTKAKAQNVPEIPFDTVPNSIKLPPGLYLGESIGVATNSKGHLFVYTRSAKTRLFEFDQNGAYVREIGEGNYGFVFAHSVRVDKQDNIWVVDEGTNMVIEFNPAGRVVMVLGRRPEVVAGALGAHGWSEAAPARITLPGRQTWRGTSRGTFSYPMATAITEW